MNFYSKHLGDYAKTTSHLSILEHGVYNLLLDRYYASQKPIPQNEIYSCIRARTKKEKAAVDSVLQQFFQITDQGWFQSRAELEIAKAARKTKDNRKVFLQSYEWRVTRMQAILKYGQKCMACGATPESGAVINVDHIKPRKTHPELALDLDNLQVLCSDCNHGKGNWDCTDWRNKEKHTGEIYG
jgi:uncharacterized protein YdaU (DUF1376 family)